MYLKFSAMLDIWFDINMPYGMEKDRVTGGWVAFNREYQNLLDTASSHEYPELTEEFIRSISEDYHTDKETGKIYIFWFYSDGTNPFKPYQKGSFRLKSYFEKLEKISRLMTKEAKLKYQ